MDGGGCGGSRNEGRDGRKVIDGDVSSEVLGMSCLLGWRLHSAWWVCRYGKHVEMPLGVHRQS